MSQNVRHRREPAFQSRHVKRSIHHLTFLQGDPHMGASRVSAMASTYGSCPTKENLKKGKRGSFMTKQRLFSIAFTGLSLRLLQRFSKLPSMSQALKTCPCCSRHIKVSDPQCPHCKSSVNDASGGHQDLSAYVRVLGLCVAAGVSSLGCLGCAYGTPPMPDDPETGTDTTAQNSSGAAPTQSSGATAGTSGQDQSQSEATTSSVSETESIPETNSDSTTTSTPTTSGT